MGIFSKANGKAKKSTFGKKPTKWNNKGIQRIATDSEVEYLSWLKSQELFCIACGKLATELHHLKFDESNKIHTSTAKKDHKLVVPLCCEHHTGNKCSFHGNKKEMAKLFTKDSLIVIANKIYQKWEEVK